ncbi:hypothetical protein [Streptomyces sp. NPDC059979]
MHDGQVPTTGLVWEKLRDEHDTTAAYATVHRYLSRHPRHRGRVSKT